MIENSITEGTKLIVRDIREEMESAFIDYSMSVITARALPDVRDGLKPGRRSLAPLSQIRRHGRRGARLLSSPWRRFGL